jgi:carboxyl-terminal processing protease
VVLLLLWPPGAVLAPMARAQAPVPDRPGASSSTTSAISDDPEETFRRALELEKQRKWAAAIELYGDALDHWPDRPELSRLRVDFVHRLRLCETHYRLGRRYQDNSFRNTLLRLPRERALELYDEVLERIETQYVEPVALDQLLRRGLDNLEVALRDPAFLQTNLTGASTERVQKLREVFRAQRDRVTARDRAEARAQVSAACDTGRQVAALPAPAIILEFVFGATDGLNDDYSNYLTPDKLDDLYAMIDGNFVGLGVELKQDEKGLRIVGVIAGGPASEAGLKAGDRITQVDGQSVAGLGLDDAASRLQGNEGTAVEIFVLRADGRQDRVRLIRRPVEVKSVAQAKIVDAANGIGYIQLTGFQKSTTDELTRAIAALQARGMRSLVLDVRGNPGGLLNVAVDIAERFIDKGVIVSTRGRAAGQSFTYRARGEAIWRMPLTVLIDHDSASASEILAGALQDHRRATIIGERSFGKGSVQSIFSLRTAPAGLKLTTAKFYSPKNRAYSEQGVEPDVPVRTAAKPARGDSASEEPIATPEFGRIDRDPVLSLAVQQAVRRPQASR